jgi:radical SAM superfamily enzyme with C-terminal helix-hairpin-helix motif
VVEPYLRHFDDKDGFQLRVQFRHVLEDEIEIRRIKIRLVSATPGQGKDIWLERTAAMQLQKGMCRTWLSSNVRIIIF